MRKKTVPYNVWCTVPIPVINKTTITYLYSPFFWQNEKFDDAPCPLQDVLVPVPYFIYKTQSSKGQIKFLIENKTLVVE